MADNKDKEKEKKKDNTLMMTGLFMAVGFVLDVGQFLVVSHINDKAAAKAAGQSYKWKFPDARSLLRTGGLIAISSLVTGLIVGGIQKAAFSEKS